MSRFAILGGTGIVALAVLLGTTSPVGAYGRGHFGHRYGGYYGGYGGGYYPGYRSYYYSPSYTVVYPPPVPVATTVQITVGAPAVDNTATVHVHVPADAVVWFNGAQMSQTGTEREFVTPALEPGRSYSYQVRAKWMNGGQPVERTAKVKVRPNETTEVDMMGS